MMDWKEKLEDLHAEWKHETAIENWEDTERVLGFLSGLGIQAYGGGYGSGTGIFIPNNSYDALVKALTRN